MDYVDIKTDWQPNEILTPYELNRIGMNQYIMYGGLTDTDTSLGVTHVNNPTSTGSSRNTYFYFRLGEFIPWYVKTGRFKVFWHVKIAGATAITDISVSLGVRSRNTPWVYSKHEHHHTFVINEARTINGMNIVTDQRIGDVVYLALHDKCTEAGSGKTWTAVDYRISVIDF